MDPVSDPPDRLYIFLRRYRFDLLPDVADMHVQGLRLPHIRLIPGTGENILFAEDLLRMTDQKFQYGEFLLCNPGDLLPFDPDLIIRLIQHQISPGDLSVPGFPARVPQLDLNPCEHVRTLNGLGDLVVRPLRQHSDLIIQTVPGG